MREYQPPDKPDLYELQNMGHPVTIFLAGSIEMGVAEMWQAKVVNELKKYKVLLFNPRRANWDVTIKQSILSKPFVDQVEWELEQIEKSDIIIFYFDGNTKSPVTMLELGLVLGRVDERREANHQQVLLCCPDEFWRSGNVEYTASRYGTNMVSYTKTFDEMIAELKHKLESMGVGHEA